MTRSPGSGHCGKARAVRSLDLPDMVDKVAPSWRRRQSNVQCKADRIDADNECDPQGRSVDRLWRQRRLEAIESGQS